MNKKVLCQFLGFGVALATAFAVLLFLLYLNWRITLWGTFALSCICCLWNKYKTVGGKKHGIIDKLPNRIKNTVKNTFGIGLAIFFFWICGRLLEKILGYPSGCFEITAIKGMVAVVLLIVPIIAGLEYDWWKKWQNCLLGIFIYALGIAVVWLMLTYVLPYLYGLL